MRAHTNTRAHIHAQVHVHPHTQSQCTRGNTQIHAGTDRHTRAHASTNTDTNTHTHAHAHKADPWGSHNTYVQTKRLRKHFPVRTTAIQAAEIMAERSSAQGSSARWQGLV